MDEALRETLEKNRSDRRSLMLNRRRFSDEEDYLEPDLDNLVPSLVATHFKDLKKLEQLKSALAAGDVNPDDLFRFPINDLIGLLNSETSEHEKILCTHVLANLSPLTEKNGLSLSRSSGPYLVTLLSSGSVALQESSCVALGNLALAGSKVVKVLVNQSAVESLVSVLDSPVHSVQASGYYALYHILHTCARIDEQLLSSLMDKCRSQLTVKSPPELHWVLFVLSCNSNLHHSLAAEDLVHRTLDICTYEIFQKSDSRPLVKIVTPIVRILANLCSGPEAENSALFVLRYQDLQAILMALLGTNYAHLCKETLWLIANIVNNESVVIQEELVELDFMDRLEFHTAQAIQKLDPYLTNVIH